MIDYLKFQTKIYEELTKAIQGKILVERIETNKQGTTYKHKHWISPKDLNSKTDKVIGGFHNLPKNHPQQLHPDIPNAKFSNSGENNPELASKLQVKELLGKISPKGQRYFQVGEKTYSLHGVSNGLKKVDAGMLADEDKSAKIDEKTIPKPDKKATTPPDKPTEDKSDTPPSTNTKDKASLQKEYLAALKNEYKPWLSNLSEEEYYSLQKYTGSFYRVVNSHLRNQTQPPLEGEELEDMNQEIQNITDAIDKSEVKKGVRVYRQVRGLNLVDVLKECADKDMLWEEPGFMSTTVIRGSFKASGILGTLHLQIDIPKGKGIGGFVKEISRHPEENEFLLNRGSRFKVLDVTKDPKLGMVAHLKLVGRSTDSNE